MNQRPTPVQWETREVGLLHRPNGPNKPPVMVRTRVRWVCQHPGCGGDRGKPYSVTFTDGDQQVSFDRWHNACGHVDLQVDVLREGQALQAEWDARQATQVASGQ